MKRKRFFCLACGLLLLVSFLSLSLTTDCSAASDKPIKLSFATIFPKAHLQAVLNQAFCDKIAERTDGRVEITLYPAGTLLSGYKNFEGVVKGIADIGMSCPLYVAGRFPVSEIFEMPSEIDSGWVTSKVYMDLFKEFELKEYEDVHILYLHGPGRNVLMSRKKPIRTLEDMKGMVMRASGGAASTIAALGATPRAMDMAEAYPALSKGVVEGQFAVPETLKGWKHADVVNYVSIPPLSTSSCQYVAMNKRTWNSLPSDIQKVFTEVAAEFPEYHGHVWNYQDNVGLEYFQSLEGRELITIPKEEKPEWEAAVEPVIQKYLKEKSEMGLPAEDYWNYFHERIEYWRSKKPPIEESVEWVESHLLD